MNWQISSLIMIIGSVMLYMGIRWAKALRISVSDQYLGQFIVSGIINILLMIIFGISPIIPLWQIGMILAVALIVTYGSNYASLKALEAAPNPGYSLVIQKSYVVYTAIAAALLFNKELTSIKIIGILIIVAASMFVILDNKEQRQKSDQKWIILSIITFFGFGTLSMLESALVKEIGINSLLVVFYTRFILIGVEFIKRQKFGPKFEFGKSFQSDQLKKLILLFLIGMSQFAFGFFMKEGYRLAPNPGYVSAANAASIVIIAGLSALIFKDKWDNRKSIGMAIMLIGIVLLYI